MKKGGKKEKSLSCQAISNLIYRRHWKNFANGPKAGDSLVATFWPAL